MYVNNVRIRYTRFGCSCRPILGTAWVYVGSKTWKRCDIFVTPLTFVYKTTRQGGQRFNQDQTGENDRSIPTIKMRTLKLLILKVYPFPEKLIKPNWIYPESFCLSITILKFSCNTSVWTGRIMEKATERQKILLRHLNPISSSSSLNHEPSVLSVSLVCLDLVS